MAAAPLTVAHAAPVAVAHHAGYGKREADSQDRDIGSLSSKYNLDRRREDERK